MKGAGHPYSLPVHPSIPGFSLPELSARNSREGSVGAPFHPDHRGHLRAPDPRGEPGGGQPADRNGRKSATYMQPGRKKGSGGIA